MVKRTRARCSIARVISRRLAPLAIVLTFSCATSTPRDDARPSAGATQSIEFLGRTFTLAYQTQQPMPVYEYFLAGEKPDVWTELVDLRVYPTTWVGNAPAPLELAKGTLSEARKNYPAGIGSALYTKNGSDEVIIDFLLPDSTLRSALVTYFEFNAFRFFRDAGSPHVMSLHYAKNVEGPHAGRPKESFFAEVKELRKSTLSALTDSPLYRR